MKKKTYLLMVTTVFMVLFVSACGRSAAPATQAAPPVEIVPTEAAAPLTSVPVPVLAPACQASDSCSAPDVKDTAGYETYCVQKVPYQNILIDEGVTFEALDPNKLTCIDNGTIVDGKRVLECHGTALWTSELKLTNSACGGSASLATGTGQCQEGLGYDAAQNCCAVLAAADTGSVTIKVNMGACP